MALGFAVMVLAVGLGLGAVFQAYPAIYAVRTSWDQVPFLKKSPADDQRSLD